jgi:hypothetical protein
LDGIPEVDNLLVMARDVRKRLCAHPFGPDTQNKCNGVTVNTGIAVAPRFTDLPGSSPASIGPPVFEQPFLGLLIGMAL